MPYPTAKITVDHIWHEGDVTPSRAGTLIHYPEGQQAEESLTILWRTLDDDGIVYYEGYANSDGLELAFDWSQTDAGSVLLQTREDGEWKDCIA
jgi:hypothetical protein